MYFYSIIAVHFFSILTFFIFIWKLQRAADYFSPEIITTDDLLHLYAYWSRLEVTLGGDITAARGVWESLIKKRFAPCKHSFFHLLIW